MLEEEKTIVRINVNFCFLFCLFKKKKKKKHTHTRLGHSRENKYMWTSLFTRNIIGKNCFYRLRMSSSSTALKPKLYVLQYDYVADAFEKRKPHREAHLTLLNKQLEKGNVVLAGAVDNPPTGGILIFRNLTPDDIEQNIVKQDPYVVNGVVEKYTIKPYLAVVGDALLNNDLIKI